MITTRLIAWLLLLCTLGYMAMTVACSTVAPAGYDAASEQRTMDQIEWQDDPWR